MKYFSFALSMFALGCGGECVPKSAVNADSFAVTGPPGRDLAMAHSIDELRAAIAAIPISPPFQSPIVAGPDPAELAKAEKARLEAFVTATTFATQDVAIVRAGTGRARLSGVVTEGDRVTLYFVGQCSPCGGGNPGSYMDALAGDQAARAARTELVRVPKNARVAVHDCDTSCGACPNNVP